MDLMSLLHLSTMLTPVALLKVPADILGRMHYFTKFDLQLLGSGTELQVTNEPQVDICFSSEIVHSVASGGGGGAAASEPAIRLGRCRRWVHLWGACIQGYR